MSIKNIAAAVFTAATGAAAYGYWQNNALQLSESIVYSDIEKPLKLLCISDLHGKQFGKNNCRLLTKVRALSPDIIVFPGDTISSDRSNFEETIATLRELSSIAPCFLIPGNHEHRSGQWERICKRISACGVTVLQNNRWDGYINETPVHILGLDEQIAVHRTDYIRSAAGTLHYPDNSALLQSLSEQPGVKIVLSHFPECFVKANYCRFDFDLMISGHAHGGHFRLNDQISFFAAGQGFLPKFNCGLYGDRPQLFVSRGLGNDSPLPRINNRPELAAITILKKQSL